MDDLVESLRDNAECGRYCGSDYMRAADEIEQLRAQLAEAKAEATKWHDCAEKQSATIKFWSNSCCEYEKKLKQAYSREVNFNPNTLNIRPAYPSPPSAQALDYVVISAFMAGQVSCGVDPSWSQAREYLEANRDSWNVAPPAAKVPEGYVLVPCGLTDAIYHAAEKLGVTLTFDAYRAILKAAQDPT